MDEKLLHALRCPKTGGELAYRAATADQPEGLYSEQAHLLYPIRDGIPILLIEQGLAIAPTAE